MKIDLSTSPPPSIIAKYLLRKLEKVTIIKYLLLTNGAIEIIFKVEIRRVIVALFHFIFNALNILRICRRIYIRTKLTHLYAFASHYESCVAR